MVRTLSKEGLHIPDQLLLQVLKAFENVLESQLKYITGKRAWNNFCACVDQWCSRERNLRDRDLVKTSISRLHQKLRDSRLEIGDRDPRRQNLSIVPKFCFECRHHFWVDFFLIFGIFQHVLVVAYLQIQQKKNPWILVILLNYSLAIFKVSRPVAHRDWDKTWHLWDRNSQKWVSRLHHWFWHRCILHLLQRILFFALHVRQWWSLEIWSWSRRDFPFFQSQSRRFEVLSWSRSQVHSLEALSTAKILLSKTFVNQRVFGLLYLQIRNNQSRQEKCQKFEKIDTS